jgi:GT2 family glycosyltransferase
MEAAMIKHELDTASPRSPTEQTGIVARAEIKHRYTPETMVRVGFELIINFCGWCWVMKREVKDWLFPVDEQFAFFFQDNDIIMRLQEKGCKHGMVAASKVDHYGQKSHGTFRNQEEYMKNTFALEQNFIEKWRHRM